MDKPVILITGGNGFLGSNLASRFAGSEARVIITVRKSSKLARLKKIIKLGKVKTVFADPKSLKKLFVENRVETVIHTATNYGRHGETLKEIRAVNTDLPCMILEIGKALGLKYFINTDTFLPENAPEEDKYFNYVRTKKDLILKAKKILQDSAIKFINARIYHMYGPNDNPDKFFPWVIQQLLLGGPKIELSPGKQVRDFIYISDVVSAFAAILRHVEEFRSFEHFEIGTGKALPLKTAVELMKKLSHSPTKLLWGKREYEPGEIMESRAPVEKNRKIGWHAQVDLETGLCSTVNYYIETKSV